MGFDWEKWQIRKEERIQFFVDKIVKLVNYDFNLVYNMNYSDIVNMFAVKRDHLFEIREHLFAVKKNNKALKTKAAKLVDQINCLFVKTTRLLFISDQTEQTQQDILRFIFKNEEQFVLLFFD